MLQIEVLKLIRSSDAPSLLDADDKRTLGHHPFSVTLTTSSSRPGSLDLDFDRLESSNII